MKRLTAVLLAIILFTGAFASCGKNNDYDTISTTDPYQIRVSIGNRNLDMRFYLEIYNESGELSAYSVYTEKNTLAEALEEYMMGKFEKDKETDKTEISLTDYTLKSGREWAVYVKGIRTNLSPANIVLVKDTTYTFSQVPEGK